MGGEGVEDETSPPAEVYLQNILSSRKLKGMPGRDDGFLQLPLTKLTFIRLDERGETVCLIPGIVFLFLQETDDISIPFVDLHLR